MNKLIAAIEALPDGKKLVYAVSTNEVVHGYNYACTTDDLKALVAQLKWIPVSERLPEGYDAGNVRANVWDNVGANVWDNVGAYATATAKIERLENVLSQARAAFVLLSDTLEPRSGGNLAREHIAAIDAVIAKDGEL